MLNSDKKLEELEDLLLKLNIQIFTYSALILKIDGIEYGIYDNEDSYSDVSELPRSFDSEVLIKKH